MKQHINIFVEPKPTPRPRFVSRGKFVSTYFPKDYVAYAQALADMIAEYREAAWPMTGPLRLSLQLYCEKPKTSKLSAPRFDVDNGAKGVMDAMTKAGVWEDDAQVVELTVRKSWGTDGAIHIAIETA